MNEGRDTLQNILGALGFGSSSPTFGSEPINVETEQSGTSMASPNNQTFAQRNKFVIIGGVAVASILLFLYFKKK
jgi:hypothetical protein